MANKNELLFLNNLQLDLVSHANSRSLYEHCLSVAGLMQTFGARQELISAGLFHSIYGRDVTSFSPPLDFSSRQNLVNLIGKESENIVYINCILENSSLWRELSFFDREQNRFNITNRLSGAIFNISIDELHDLVFLNFANDLDHSFVNGVFIRNEIYNISQYISVLDLLPSSVSVFLLKNL